LPSLLCLPLPFPSAAVGHSEDRVWRRILNWRGRWLRSRSGWAPAGPLSVATRGAALRTVAAAPNSPALQNLVRLTPTGFRRRHGESDATNRGEPPRRIALKKAVSIDSGTRRIGSRSYRERTPAREVVDKIGRNDASRPDVQWGIPIEAARLVFTSARFATPPGAGLAGGAKGIRTAGPRENGSPVLTTSIDLKASLLRENQATFSREGPTVRIPFPPPASRTLWSPKPLCRKVVRGSENAVRGRVWPQVSFDGPWLGSHVGDIEPAHQGVDRWFEIRLTPLANPTPA
jgi:hypothetical protein